MPALQLDAKARDACMPMDVDKLVDARGGTDVTALAYLALAYLALTSF